MGARFRSSMGYCLRWKGVKFESKQRKILKLRAESGGIRDTLLISDHITNLVLRRICPFSSLISSLASELDERFSHEGLPGPNYDTLPE